MGEEYYVTVLIKFFRKMEENISTIGIWLVVGGATNIAIPMNYWVQGVLSLILSATY